MVYDDPLYGPEQIDEPQLLDLMESQALLRLRGVLQHGVSALLGITKPITRFEHSVGVMLVVRRLGADLREQIAALLHDVSHTAFSHVIDHVFHDQGTQSFHEQRKAWWLERTDVPAILGRHGLDWRDFLDDESHPLLEQPLPRLCADRLDYVLRDGSALGVMSHADVRAIRDHVVACEGRLAMDDQRVARMLGERFMACDDGSWSDRLELVVYELAARAIRASIDHGVISEDDLWRTDAVVWEQMRESNHPEVARWVQLTEHPPKFVDDWNSPTIRIRPKVRAIDPDVVTKGGLRRLSELDVEFRDLRERYCLRKAEGLSVRLLET